MKNMIFQRFFSALLSFSSFFIALQSHAGDGGEAPRRQLKVGVVLGLTGMAATHADGIKKGIELAAENLRAEGWELDLNYQDDEGNPAKTVRAIQFLQSKGYQLFIGPTWSFQVSAAQKVLSQPGIVAIVPGGSSDINGGPGPGIFNLCPLRLAQRPLVAEWLKKKGFKRPYILTPIGDWGEVHRTVYQQAIIDAGLREVGNEQFNYGVDLATITSMLEKAKSVQADVILATGSAADDSNLLKARENIRLNAAILTTDTLRDIVVLNLLPKGDSKLSNVFALELPMDPAFKELYVKRYHVAPLGCYSDRGYDALRLLAHAAATTDGSGSAIRELFRARVDFLGASGRIRFSADGDVFDSSHVIVSGQDIGFEGAR